MINKIKCESPAETCNPAMIENGPLAVMATRQLTKQQTHLSVMSEDYSLCIRSKMDFEA